jgi:transcription-repair coupling factor (superfamily II helicase)
MYQKILTEAVKELKETEFKDLYKDNDSDNFFVEDCQIDTDMEILIPDNYVNSISERLQLYKDFNNLSSEEELQIYEQELTDRFGPIPSCVEKLLSSMKLRWVAKDLGFEKIVLKSKKMIAYFTSNPQSEFFESDDFQKILLFIQRNPRACQMKERNNKLSLVFENVQEIDVALNRILKIKESWAKVINTKT